MSYAGTTPGANQPAQALNQAPPSEKLPMMQADISSLAEGGVESQRPLENTAKPAKRPHVSSSAIDAYLDRCGEFYRLKYIERKPATPTMPLHKGTAIHAASEKNFAQKITSRQDISTKTMQEVAAAAFDDRIKAEGYMLTSEEESTGSKLVLARAKDRAVVLTEIFGNQVAPIHQPVLVEQFQRIRLNEEMDLLVKLDLINDKGEIPDIKSSKQSWNQKKADDSLQFSLYGLAYRAIYKKDPAAVVVENLVDAPKHPKLTRIITMRGMPHYQKAIEKINLFLHGVKSGVFIPAKRGDWFCNESHCPYARGCKYFQFYQKGGGKQSVPFWMKYGKKKGAKNGTSK